MVSASELRAQWSQLFAPADRTLPAMLRRQAERFAQKPLLTAGRTTWTYAETYEAAARCAGTLRSAGIQPGDRGAIICSNRIEFLEIVLGCAWLGAAAGDGSGVRRKSGASESGPTRHRSHLVD